MEAAGVGYDVAISVSTYTSLPADGAEVALHIHTQVREDTLALYGFLDRNDKRIFERLITVSGVGGSTGYGDKFLMEIVPQIVSRPGKDILAGVDALVKDGIADPDHLTVGGYSYGGYMTNWLITQTTRFKAAVTELEPSSTSATGATTTLPTTTLTSPADVPGKPRSSAITMKPLFFRSTK